MAKYLILQDISPHKKACISGRAVFFRRYLFGKQSVGYHIFQHGDCGMGCERNGFFSLSRPDAL
jgi:hypothetical protein